MSQLQIDPEPTPLTPAQSLSGWRRELCIELQGNGAARIFVRAVQDSSFRAIELQRGVLFQRVDARFSDLAGCVQALQPALDRLVLSARRLQPDKGNLFQALEYDGRAWEQVQLGVEHWMRRPLR
jgi:hypothetical protein